MDRELFLSRTQTLLEQGSFEGALEMARRWLDRNPGDVNALTVQCQACMRLGKLDEAMAVMTDVEKTILGLSRIYACMGDICFKGGLNQEALKFYRRFVELDPDSDVSRNVLDRLRILKEDYPEGNSGGERQDAQGQLATAGFQTMTMVDLYIRQGHLAAADSLLEQMLAKETDNREMREKLAAVRLEMNRKAANRRQQEAVLGKLRQWLDQLQRRRLHAI